MKKIGLLLLCTLILNTGFGQESGGETKVIPEQETAEDTLDVVRVVVGKDRVIINNDNDRTTIRVGNREIIILDSLENRMPKIEIEKKEEKKESQWNYDYDSREERERRRRHFKGHWSGLSAGFNYYCTSDRTISLPSSIDYMTLHTGKSNNFQINFAQLSMGLSRHTGFVTGLGLNWNNYVFDGDNNIVKGENDIIEMLDPGMTLKKSKFTVLYFNIPFLFEFQIPTDHQRLNISAGPVGAVKLHSHTKMIFDNKDKIKSDDDLSLNMFRYGATARIGYENFNLYGTCYFSPLFKTGKSPGNIDLFPFEIGLAFTID